MNFYTFGKDRYHLNNEMEQWCKENIGQGGWSYANPKTWEGMHGNWIWVMSSMFGNTTFSFKDPNHLTLFLLRWS
jgi:hypothetical protein